MDIRKVRRERLKAAVGEFPTVAAFAKKFKLDATYIRQLLGGHREVGEKAARGIEVAMGKSPGWLDQVDVGKPFPEGLGSDEMEWLEIYRALKSKEGKKAAFAAMGVFMATWAGPEPSSQQQGGRSGGLVARSKT